MLPPRHKDGENSKKKNPLILEAKRDQKSMMSPDSRGSLLLGEEKETHLLKSLSPTKKKKKKRRTRQERKG